VGAHEDLLPYLVRRLLENGANTSFVNRVVDERQPAAAVVADPVAEVDRLAQVAHARIVLPRELFGSERANSQGVNFADAAELTHLKAACEAAAATPWRATALINGKAGKGERLAIINPANLSQCIGEVVQASAGDVERALAGARSAWPAWEAREAGARAAILERAAELFEARRHELVARCVLEAGKTLPDSVAEVPVEFSTCDLYRSGRRGARRRQCGRGQACRADAAHRRACCAIPA
jgi:RHH-type proline utilization regulon transcriptional repressor/proline dehydrogenase/delta 1-pyrroline-5-carboxylate dehydrogenase